MPLKSTNIWDDIREKDDGEKSDSEGWSDRFRSSVRRGSSPATKVQEERSLARSNHATRHGVSMKSLMKNR